MNELIKINRVQQLSGTGAGGSPTTVIQLG